MKKKKHNPRSEAAQREALRDPTRWQWQLDRVGGIVEVWDLSGLNDELIAVFNLRDCYRKRKPLKGIMKATRKAIQPRGKR